MPSQYQNQTDEQLVAVIQQDHNNKEAVNTLYYKYVDYIRSLVCEKLNSKIGEFDFEQVVEDIIMKIFNNIEEYNTEKALFKTWMVRIALNHIVDVYRGIARLKEYHFISVHSPAGKNKNDEDENTATFGDTVEGKEKGDLDDYLLNEIYNFTISAFDAVKDGSAKDVVLYKLILGFPDEDICKLFNISESCMRAHVTNALKEFRKNFEDSNKAYPGITEEVCGMVREGWIHINISQIDTLEDSKVKGALKLRIVENKSFKEIAKKLKVSETEAEELIKSGISHLLKKGVRRKMKEPSKGELSEMEQKSLSEYMELLATGKVARQKTRSDSESQELCQMKETAALLSMAFNKGIQAGSRSIGSIIHVKMEKQSLDLDALKEKLGLDIHKFTALLSNRITPELKSDKNLIKKLSDFLNVTPGKVKALMDISQPASMSSKTRKEVTLDEKFHKKTLNKIYKSLAEKK